MKVKNKVPERRHIQMIFFFFIPTQKHVVGTCYKHLIEMFLMSTTMYVFVEKRNNTLIFG